MVAKVFVMTRDEYDLIEDFIAYHGAIFGMDNLVIIDNNSTHPAVLAAYDKYRPLGVTIVNAPSYVGESQGREFTTVMKRYADQCTWLIGLDTDEFLVCSDHVSSSPSFDDMKHDILTTLASIPPQVSVVRVTTNFNSVVDPLDPGYEAGRYRFPARQMTRFQRVGSCKTFYRAATFVCTHMGNHSGRASCGVLADHARLAYVHFHMTGKARHFERARMHVVDGFKHVDGDPRTHIERLQPLLGNRSLLGLHRVEQYVGFLLSGLVVDLYARHLGRYPTREELEVAPDADPRAIEQQLAGRAQLAPLVVDDRIKRDLLFRDGPPPDGALRWTGLAGALAFARAE